MTSFGAHQPGDLAPQAWRPLQPPLSEDERLLVACMRTIARSIASSTHGLAPADADQFVALEVFDFIDSLGSVSQAFALETARYLTDAVRRLRQN